MILNNMTQPLTYLEIIVMSQFYRINSMWDISTGYYINFMGNPRILKVVKFVIYMGHSSFCTFQIKVNVHRYIHTCFGNGLVFKSYLAC